MVGKEQTKGTPSAMIERLLLDTIANAKDNGVVLDKLTAIELSVAVRNLGPDGYTSAMSGMLGKKDAGLTVEEDQPLDSDLEENEEESADEEEPHDTSNEVEEVTQDQHVSSSQKKRRLLVELGARDNDQDTASGSKKRQYQESPLSTKSRKQSIFTPATARNRGGFGWSKPNPQSVHFMPEPKANQANQPRGNEDLAEVLEVKKENTGRGASKSKAALARLQMLQKNTKKATG